MKLRVFSTFSGYESQCLGLDRLGIDYELVGWSEIDKYAIQAHNALYPQWAGRNYGDITKICWQNVPDFDLLTYSSPCQDFSQAGISNSQLYKLAGNSIVVDVLTAIFDKMFVHTEQSVGDQLTLF